MMCSHAQKFSGFFRLIALLVATALGFSGCASTVDREHEAMTGDEIHQQILAEHYVYTEPGVNEYVTEIGEAISEVSSRKRLNYDFIILYDDKVYATSIPGGRVYVTTGMLAFLENEAELAGVLAHEIGQRQYRDPEFSMIRKTSGVAGKVASVAAPFFGPIGALALLGIGGVHMASSIRRSKEGRAIVADKTALKYMLNAGYDPQGLLDLLYRIVEMKPTHMYQIMDYYWGRPITVKRFESLKKNFKKLSFQNREMLTNRERFLNEIKPIREMYKTENIS